MPVLAKDLDVVAPEPTPSPLFSPVELALEELAYFCDELKVLGVYPADPGRP